MGDACSSGNKGGDGQRASLFAAGPLGERVTLRVNAETQDRDPIAKKEDRRYSEIKGGHDSRATAWAAASVSAKTRASTCNGTAARKPDAMMMSVAPRSPTRISTTSNAASAAWPGRVNSAAGGHRPRVYDSEIDITNRRTNGVATTRPQNIRDEVVDGFAAIKLGGHILTVGGEHRTETLKNSGLIGGKDDAKHKALFIQDEIALGGETDADRRHSATITANLFGNDHPRLPGVEASPELVIKDGYGRASRPQTLKQVQLRRRRRPPPPSSATPGASRQTPIPWKSAPRRRAAGFDLPARRCPLPRVESLIAYKLSVSG